MPRRSLRGVPQGLPVGIMLALGVVLSPAGAADMDRFPVTIRDAAGATVEIRTAPRRIVSLAPSVTEILFALGLDREVVGISDADDYPPEALRSRTRIGGVVINVEQVVALRPDLVVGLPSLQRDQLARLRALGLPVLGVDAATVRETIAQVRLLGRATGRASVAGALAASMERRAAAVRPAREVPVYIEAWSEPLLAAAAGTLIDDLATRAGGVNVFADRRGYVQVAAEAVIVRNPTVIFLLYAGEAGLRERPGWRSVAAVRAGRVHALPTSLVARPGPRVIEGLELVARLLRAAAGP